MGGTVQGIFLEMDTFALVIFFFLVTFILVAGGVVFSVVVLAFGRNEHQIRLGHLMEEETNSRVMLLTGV